MRKPAINLPDIPMDDDANFKARLNPLAEKVLPKTPESRMAGVPDDRITGTPRQTIALRRDEIEAKRGPKKRYEYVLPLRVGEALAESARKDGVSATVRLLEVLRKAGYPVIPEDLIDLRLESGRK
jgi:hypothetical protein